MAKQKPAPGKKTPKAKAERAGTNKSARKRPVEPSKSAPKAPAAATRKKASTATATKPAVTKTSPAPAPKASDKKAVAKATKAVAAVKTAPKQAVAKVAKPVGKAPVATKAPVAAKTTVPAKAAPQPVAKKPVAGKVAVAQAPASKKPEAAKPAKAPAPVVKPLVGKPKVAAAKTAPPPPRPIPNGPVAGVLQAARSVASKTTKVVEVEKERKSHLTVEELNEFRQILLDKRRELVDDMVNLEDEARRTGSEGNSGSSAMPIHMADLGSDTWEQEFTLNLIEKERGIVREIDEALDRIEKKTYGTCLATGKAISKARLRVKPWAKYCIEYARKRELGLT